MLTHLKYYRPKLHVSITIDLSLKPALNAIFFYNSNLLSTIACIFNKLAKGGTLPGFSLNIFHNYYSLNILLFFPSSYIFLILFQLSLWFARYSSIQISSFGFYYFLSLAYFAFGFPRTNIVLLPHYKGVFLIFAD